MKQDGQNVDYHKSQGQDHMGPSYSSLYFSTCVKFFYNKNGNKTVGEWEEKQRFETEVTAMVQATSHQHAGQY